VNARAALLDLAERIDTGKFEKLPDASLARLAGILRVEADRYPDQAAGEPITAELVGMPALDVDQQLRVAALHAATAGRLPAADPDETISEARVFEAYLRGEQA
jgi:hypothetical protein